MKVRNQVNFAIIPEWILCAEISAQAIRLYAVLNREATKAGRGRVHPSRRELADAMHVKQSTVDRALDDLQRIGALEVSARRVNRLGQTSNDYLVRQIPKTAEQMMTPLPIYDQGGVITGDEGPLLTGEQPKDKSSSTKSSKDLKARAPSSKRTRIDSDFWPTEQMLLDAREKFPGLELRRESEKFKVHYLANGAVMASWNKAWWSWLYKSRDFARASPNGSKHRGIDAKWERTE